MATDDVLCDLDEGVGWITLNRPEVLNAFTPEMLTTAREAVLDWGGDPAVRVIVITGAGRGFCSGGNVKQMEMTVHAGQPAELGAAHPANLRPVAALAYALHDCPKPLIASVNGAAVGAGFELALHADLRIAAASAYLKPAALRIGMIPGDGSAFFLPHLVGYAKAAEIMFTERSISSDEALRLGLFNEVVPDAELRQATTDLARELAAKAPIALQLTKKSLKLGVLHDLHEVMEYLGVAIAITRGTEDHKEGLRALREKRPPLFEGR
jgi:enoyl-CoA hydratase/carnithine racemase